MTIPFGDSENPARIPFDHAALYSNDCAFPCPPGAANRWAPANRRWITQGGAPDCSILDYEQYTKVYSKPIEIDNWLDIRDSDRDKYPRESWIYSDLDNSLKAYGEAKGRSFKWWVATLDGFRHSRQELVNLLNDRGVPATLADIAAEQWKDVYDDYDESQLFTSW